METSALLAAYESFLEMAGSGPFDAPANPHKWTAEQIVAHIVANDQLMSATITELLEGRTPNHDNRPAIRDRHVRAIVAAVGEMEALMAAVRQSSAVLCELVRQVDTETATRPFPVFLQSGQMIGVDGPWTLDKIIEVHALKHLPGHTQQLQALKRKG